MEAGTSGVWAGRCYAAAGLCARVRLTGQVWVNEKEAAERRCVIGCVREGEERRNIIVF